MKIGFLITGRMKSSRLPRKLTLKILDKEIISWMIDRAKLYFKNDEIVIATSTNPQDDVLEEIAKENDVKIFRGDEDDVVLRLYEAATENNFQYFINITADCPLFGFDYLDKIIKLMIDSNADLATSLDLPHGVFTYGIKTEALRKVIEIKKTNNTEVWGDYFYNNPEIFKVVKLNVDEDEKREKYRLTVDYHEDFMLFEKIFQHFGLNTYKVTTSELIYFLDENPEISKINIDCNKLYLDRWEAQKATKIERE
ncbi:MAG: 3-deoxy-manno-octulosonate cytidylyltransferase [Pyrinomonadaceae bacterium]|nr:3-deoxy-manno-octulosonate cytidylyltransferase [Sphingobacteriaceae bacterium]